MDDLRSDLAGTAIGTMTGGAVLIVYLLSLRDGLAVAGKRIGRPGGRPATLRLDRQNRQRDDQTDQQDCDQGAPHGFFSAAEARSGRPKVRMLVPDAIARY